MSAFALGNFVGPTVAGFVTEWKGFRTTTLAFLGLYVVMMVFDVSEAIYKAVKRRREVAYQLMN
jgi:putative Mn2+ efflux pump MntP